MEISQLTLPARYAAGTHFKTAYGAAHAAADSLHKLADFDGRIRTDAGKDEVRRVMTSLSEALCAARELDNLLAGNQPPRRGE
jgi:hypothetical protein